MHTTELPIGRVLEEIAATRGYSGLEELADAVNATVGAEYTAEKLADWPRVGFGADVDRVLNLTDEEIDKLVAAWKERLGV